MTYDIWPFKMENGVKKTPLRRWDMLLPQFNSCSTRLPSYPDSIIRDKVIHESGGSVMLMTLLLIQVLASRLHECVGFIPLARYP